MRNLPVSFLRILETELPALVKQHLLTEETSRKIRDYYHLDDLGTDSSSRMSGIIYLIGSLLIAGGVIAFVAYHWEAMAALSKVFLITSSLIFAHATGWYLSRVKKMTRLGESLIFLGTLIFFADIALMAQIFHITSSSGDGYLAFYFGAIAMAFAIESVPNFLLASLGFLVWVGHEPWGGEMGSHIVFSIQFFFVVTSAWFSWRVRSSPAMVISWLIATFALDRTLVMLMSHQRESLALAATLTASGILAALVNALLSGHERTRRFERPLEAIALLILSSAAFLSSFRDYARDIAMECAYFPGLMSGSILFSISTCGVIFLRERKRGRSLTFTNAPSLTLAFAGSSMMILQFHPIFAVISGNVAAALLGCFALKTGLDHGLRGRFWFGLSLITIVIASRFFEYDTELHFKSAVFILLGLFVIAGGIAFERRAGVRR